MSSMLKDPYFIQRSIFTFFAAKMTRDDILAKLLRAHEHQPKFFPRVDYRDVDFWLKSFEEGNFDLEQVPTYSEKATLVNLPVIESIIHMGNIKEQAALRGTCRSFKNVLDSAERLFEEIYFGTTQNAMFLNLSYGISCESLEAVYRSKGTGCEITKDGETIQSEKDFITEAFEDFKKTINKEQRNNFYDNIVKILSKLKSKLHVEKLQVSVWTPDQVLTILGEIDQNNLTALHIDSHEQRQSFIMDDIVSQPFWKNLKCLELKGSTLQLKLDNVQHILQIRAHLFCTFTTEEIKNHRDSILKMPDLRWHNFWFRGWDVPPPVEEWVQAMKPFTPILNEFGEDKPLTGRFPLTNGKVIKFELNGRQLLFMGLGM